MWSVVKIVDGFAIIFQEAIDKTEKWLEKK